ncbi:origin recognition complex subunit 2-domain-containing protein [Cryomyces antarcticus]
MKRSRLDDTPDELATTPKKARTDDYGFDDEIAAAQSAQATPSKRQTRSILKDTPERANGATSVAVNGIANGLTNGVLNRLAKGDETPRSQRKVLFSTPTHTREEDKTNGTPTIVRNADRSARRKSARRLLERNISDNLSDEEDLDGEDALARQIWDEDEGSEDEVPDIAEEDLDAVIPDTPSKRGRGRPKKDPTQIKRRKRSPTPPQNLPPHEQYFFQNRPGGTKTSSNTLSSLSLLNHEDYFAQLKAYTDPHANAKGFLQDLHARSFDQWAFELRLGFNICLYGWGSKRDLVMKFAEHLHHTFDTPPKIVVVNGYTSTLTLRDILNTLASQIIPKSAKLPAQPPALLDLLFSTLSTSPPPAPLTLLIHSLDAPPLRRPSTQAAIARLAAHPAIRLLATADTPTFPLLWDLSLRAQLNFLFHDCTTFADYSVELDVVEEVNSLLGRSGRRIGGRDGAGYVLRSLPENARSLFRILVAEQLAASDDGDDDGNGDDDDDGMLEPPTPSRRKRKPAANGVAAASGVEYRLLYHKAVEEFVCSSEMAFRTLLKEFHDHQMVETRRDGLGAEVLWVPFRRDELEALLEELVG